MIVQAAIATLRKNYFIPLDEWESRRTLGGSMKVYRVILNSFGSTFVEADSYVEDTSVRFYRGGHVTAEFLCSTVKRVEETTMKPQCSLFSGSAPLVAESRS